MRLSDIENMTIGPDRVIRGFAPNFRKLDADWDDYIEALYELDRMGRVEAVEGQVLYHSHGVPGFDWLSELYWQRGLLDEIEAYHTASGDGSFATLHLGTRAVCERLLTMGEADRARRIWRAHVALAKPHFWWFVAERDRGFRPTKNWLAPEAEQRASHDRTVARLPEIKDTMRAILTEWRDFAVRSGAPAREIARIDADIADVEREARSLPDGPVDRRKMTEEVFWDVIGNPATPVADRIDGLTDRLARFTPAAIRGFERHLRTLDAALYRTDIWALAYLLRGGCSDDAFADFRGWLIWQGAEVVAQVLDDPDRFDTTLYAGDAGGMDVLRDAAPLAHELRAGKPMKPVKTPPLALRGPDLDEADFATALPRIARLAGTAA